MVNFAKRFLIVLCFLGIFNYANGQNSEVGLSGGLCYYYGELNPIIPFHSANLTGGLFVRHNFTKRLAIRVTANYASLDAADSLSGELPSRDGWFKSQIITTNALFEVNFLPFYIGAQRQFITPYLVGGVGCTFPLSLEGGFKGPDGQQYLINEQGVTGDGISLQSVNNKISIQLAFGFGLKYSISKHFGLHAEWMMYRHFVDWIDGMYYYNYNGLSPKMFKPLEQSPEYEMFKDKDLLYICNTASVDWHSFFEIGVSFSFNLFNVGDCKDQRRSR